MYHKQMTSPITAEIAAKITEIDNLGFKRLSEKLGPRDAGDLMRAIAQVCVQTGGSLMDLDRAIFEAVRFATPSNKSNVDVKNVEVPPSLTDVIQSRSGQKVLLEFIGDNAAAIRAKLAT